MVLPHPRRRPPSALLGSCYEHGADDVIRYGVEVRACRWDQPGRRWLVTTTAGSYAAKALVMAAGPWHQPRYPDIPGLAGFPGAVFHSARWDHEADLDGRRIAVVGNAASTVQFLPELQRRGAHIDVFQSTAPWVLPKPDYALPTKVRRLLERRPTARRLVRGMHHWTQEAIGLALRLAFGGVGSQRHPAPHPCGTHRGQHHRGGRRATD
ncbi:NAD(P)-binding domain-containing protein [Streptomyces sp. HUAS TT7]|uniref:NAD(P)-binding domain-containing protein n=1 Tax=Streptomyces sp. HUAS TT7 TaxID=3447507 RepID=UPI003F660399